jgi:hypothetical protein
LEQSEESEGRGAIRDVAGGEHCFLSGKANALEILEGADAVWHSASLTRCEHGGGTL